MYKNNKIYIAIIVLIVLCSVLAVFYKFVQTGREGKVEKLIDTTDWVVYTNEHYVFSLKHPKDWKVNEAPANKPTPIYNIYKPGSDKSRLPFDHHTDGVTHVSIYPQGIPTEGVFGESLRSGVEFTIPVQNPRDYILDDGTVWATYAKVSEQPSTWNDSGFIFSSVDVNNIEAGCMRKGKRVSDEDCSPLFGDTIIRKGTVNEQDRRITTAIMESIHFIDNKGYINSSYKDLIRIEHPLPETTVSSPLEIEGAARGHWYFEGDFPVVLTDWDGKIIATGIARAQDNWMTTDYVPYKATLNFDIDTQVSNRGSLILRKDNASGLPEHDDAFEFNVFFEKEATE